MPTKRTSPFPISPTILPSTETDASVTRCKTTRIFASCFEKIDRLLVDFIPNSAVLFFRHEREYLVHFLSGQVRSLHHTL
jgi:hypothetical protein